MATDRASRKSGRRNAKRIHQGGGPAKEGGIAMQLTLTGGEAALIMILLEERKAILEERGGQQELDRIKNILEKIEAAW
jgi:hypothetical protein